METKKKGAPPGPPADPDRPPGSSSTPPERTSTHREPAAHLIVKSRAANDNSSRSGLDEFELVAVTREVTRLLGRRGFHDVEDLTQEACAAALGPTFSYCGRAALHSFLLKAALHAAFKRARRLTTLDIDRIEIEPANDNARADDLAMAREELKRVLENIAKLPEMEAEAIRKELRHELLDAEIERDGRHRVAVHRARRKLATHVD